MTPVYHYKRGPRTARKPPDNEEERLQTEGATMLEWCKPPDMRFGATLSGAYLGDKQRAKAAKMGLRGGLPDFIIVYRGETFHAECKTPTGRQSPDQKLWEGVAGPRSYFVWHTVDELHAALVGRGIPMRPLKRANRWDVG